MADSGDKNTKRDRTLTDKGEDLHQSNKAAYLSKLQKLWTNIEALISDIENQTTLESLRVLNDKLNSIYVKYTATSQEYTNFLVRTKTNESQKEAEYLMDVIKSHNIVIDSALKQIFMKTKTFTLQSKASSHRSGRSSANSKRSSILVQKRAELEASKTKLKFAEEEAKIHKQKAMIEEQQELSNAKVSRQKAELQVDLNMLVQKKETEAAKVELEVYEAEEEVRSGLALSEYDVNQDINVVERTNKFVEEQVKNTVNQPTEREDLVTPIQRQYPDFVPTPRNLMHTARVPPANTEQSITSEFTRFLLKKDLLLTRLSSFNDRPEFYTLWKSTFLSIMQELSVNTSEELDLLIKWLGPESSKNATSIRASNHSDPQRGLKRIWERLDERYGSPELVEATLKSKLKNFPKLTNKDHKKLYELADILGEIESTKCNEKYSSSLAYFDSSTGVLPIVNKLPYGIQEKWTNHAVIYKKKNEVTFPPFSVFVEFIRDMSRIKNDPSFFYETTNQHDKTSRTLPRSTADRSFISTRKTDVLPNSDLNNNSIEKKCSFHKTGGHTLNNCRAFKAMSISERRKLLKENGICFRCCGTSNHMKKDCKESIKCSDCGSERHATALHIEKGTQLSSPVSNHEGEIEKTDVSSRCTQICGEGFSGKSCAKTLLVDVYPDGKPENAIRTYAILDDQSNRSLARSTFFDIFGLNGSSMEYTLSTCSGSTVNTGRRACNFIVESLDRQSKLELPTLIECNQIPDQKDEIATKEVAQSYAHLHDICGFIPSLDETASTLLLIGRDLPEAYHVFDQRIGHRKSPYAQKLPLGWVIVGEACLGKVHAPEVVNVNKTFVSGTSRESIFKACPNNIKVMEETPSDLVLNDQDDSFGMTIFERTMEDNETGTSVEDRTFLEIMNKDMHKDKNDHWIAPLPFRSPRPVLQNNRAHALFRARNLDRTLQRDVLKKCQFTEFMQGILEQGHAELAPPVTEHEECWYLPVFGVYHPRKRTRCA